MRLRAVDQASIAAAIRSNGALITATAVKAKASAKAWRTNSETVVWVMARLLKAARTAPRLITIHIYLNQKRLSMNNINIIQNLRSQSAFGLFAPPRRRQGPAPRGPQMPMHGRAPAQVPSVGTANDTPIEIKGEGEQKGLAISR